MAWGRSLPPTCTAFPTREQKGPAETLGPGPPETVRGASGSGWGAAACGFFLFAILEIELRTFALSYSPAQGLIKSLSGPG